MSLVHVFVDFDETLFDHYSYLDWFDEELHKDGVLPAGRGSFSAAIDDYHDIRLQKPLLRLYRHEDHLSGVTGQDWQFVSGEMEKKVAERSNDFCYTDSHEFLRWLQGKQYDSRILTYGDGAYQRYKIGICKGAVSSFPVHVTIVPKAEFLAAQFPHEKGVLIDDKYPLELPANWHHIWITRHERLKAPKMIGEHVHQVSNLEQARGIVESL